jgi:hypothetical protein
MRALPAFQAFFEISKNAFVKKKELVYLLKIPCVFLIRVNPLDNQEPLE